MTDNTQVNTGTGDTVRDIDRSLNAVPIAAKTQVVQLDAGGQNAESLVSTANPLPVKVGAQDALTGGMPVNDANTAASLTSDQPLFATLAGDPSGDFAGVNILEKLVDDSGDLKMAVRVVNPPGKFDAQSALVASDAPVPINLVGATGQFLYIDTTGYQSLAISSPNTFGMNASINATSDGTTWNSILGVLLGSTVSAPVFSISIGNSYIFPVTAKIIRIQITLGGSAVAYLRNIPAPNPAVIMPQNVSQWSGTTPVSAGLAGVVSVGGPTANAIAPTANPNLVAGIDSGTPGLLLGVPVTRRVLTDSTGKLRLAEESPVQSFQNAPALNVQDTTQQEGQSVAELLAQMILELRINNELMGQLPNRLYTALQSLQSPPTQQQLYAGLSLSDEPAAYRSDPTIFNQ